MPWLKAIGAQVIAHAGSRRESGDRGATLGADHALSCPFDELAGAGDGAQRGGVAHVFDGVGAASWAASLASLRSAG